MSKFSLSASISLSLLTVTSHHCIDLRVSSEGEGGTHRDEMVHPRWSELTHGEPRITLVSPRINPCHLTHFQPLPMLLTKLNSSQVLVPMKVALPEDSQSQRRVPQQEYSTLRFRALYREGEKYQPCHRDRITRFQGLSMSWV